MSEIVSGLASSMSAFGLSAWLAEGEFLVYFLNWLSTSSQGFTEAGLFAYHALLINSLIFGGDSQVVFRPRREC